MSAPQSLRSATIGFLRRYPPFDRMAPADLELLADTAKLGYYPAGQSIVNPAAGPVATLFLIQRGIVQARPAESEAGRDSLEFVAGEAFPITALVAERPTTFDYVAEADTFTFEFDRDIFQTLMQRSPEFQRFCTKHMDVLLQQAAAKVRELYTTSTLGDQTFARPLAALIRKPPVTVPPDATLGAALDLMAKHKIGSVVVVDEGRRPLGLFIERSLVDLVRRGAATLDAPVARFMTQDYATLQDSALVADAAVAMVQRGARYGLVVAGETLRGLVSERDLFALQRRTMGQAGNAIARAETDADFVAAAAEIRTLGESLLAQGIGAENLTQVISALNDRLTQRMLDVRVAEHALADVRFAWLALGSEGRHEQTFSTDQDNAILFDPGESDPAPLRTRLVAFGQLINRLLNDCGFPLCKGNIMAGNPDLCLTLGEWQARFAQWIRNPTPEALLNASIFFDLRALWMGAGKAGEANLAERLRQFLLAEVSDARLFLRMMAENALQTRAPLGFFGGLVTSSRDGAEATIDLKAQGTRLFIDAARVHALAHGVAATNTAARMRAAGPQLGVKPEELDAAIDSFHFLLLLRLRHQGAAGDEAHPNRIDPRSLNELDRRILKEAMRHAAAVQERLRLDYQL